MNAADARLSAADARLNLTVAKLNSADVRLNPAGAKLKVADGYLSLADGYLNQTDIKLNAAGDGFKAANARFGSVLKFVRHPTQIRTLPLFGKGGFAQKLNVTTNQHELTLKKTKISRVFVLISGSN